MFSSLEKEPRAFISLAETVVIKLSTLNGIQFSKLYIQICIFVVFVIHIHKMSACCFLHLLMINNIDK